jgi:prepilin-type N-terminal cleavage/methylation domain-containing protein/prepilin-type processing-associated H-X9-DG protein
MKKFTLIECLIVVALIGILSSLLLPSLSKAREATRRAVCLSNQRQLSLALLNYTIDDNNHYPTMHSEPGVTGTGWSWDDQLSFYDGREALSIPTKNSWGFEEGHVQEAQTIVYRCPSDQRTVSSHGRVPRSYSLSTLYAQPAWAARGITNLAWVDDSSEMFSLSVSEIHQPSKGVILVDSQIPQNSVGHLSGATVTVQVIQGKMAETTYWSHDLWKTTFLFADGHAQYMSFPSTYAGTNKDAWSVTDVRETLWDCLK